METDEIENIKKIDVPKELKEILKQFDNALEKRKDFELGFNVFSLISNTYYKENLHSEIIHAFLDSEGKHGEGRKFLDLFLDYINSLGSKMKPEIIINKSNYPEEGLSVINEYVIEGNRRIDLLIKSKTHAIIIESKIHGAQEMRDQLKAYYKHCNGKEEGELKLTVDAILYLSIDGKKQITEKLEPEINKKLIHIAAFDLDPSKITIYNWLEKCKSESKNCDTKFIIKQYQQLLKSLRGYIMETEALKKYYEYISNPKNKTKSEEIQSLIHIQNELINYYPEKLKEKIKIEEKSDSLFSSSSIEDNFLFFLKKIRMCIIN